MGAMGFLWFGEKDKLIIEEIAKAHKLDVKEVELAYKKMVESLKKEK